MRDVTPQRLTAVPGLRMIRSTRPCAVILGPPDGMRAAAVLRGRATGTREVDALDPRHLVERIHAILLTGGSAYGLGAADGVMRWLRERGRGLPVGPAGVVPIVPTAVVFDLGRSGEPRWPTADDAARACDAAGPDVAEGSVGAGTGCTVGKAAGMQHAMKGGVGTWAQRSGDVIVAALVVVNAVGDVRDAHGEILAGARKPDGAFLDAIRYLAEGGTPLGDAARTNTTLAVVATNADLTRTQLQALANAGGDALARRIVPFGTMLDGDIVFAVSTAAVPAATPMQVEALAALVVPEAVERAVRLARGNTAVPGLADRR